MRLFEIAGPLEVVKSNLAGSTFTDVNLSSIVLENVNLSGARIEDANLSGMHITNVNLSDAYIADCALTGAKLNGILVTDLLDAYEALQKMAIQKKDSDS